MSVENRPIEKGRGKMDVLKIPGITSKEYDEIFMFAWKMNQHSEPTLVHCHGVADWSLRISEYLGLNLPPKLVYYNAFLHDVGKLDVDPKILEEAGPLPDDFKSELMKHAEYGLKRIVQMDLLWCRAGVYEHHMHADGRGGYPVGVPSLLARIVGAADVVEALGSHNRPNHNGYSPDVIAAYFKLFSGTQFDPMVADAVCELLVGDQKVAVQAAERIVGVPITGGRALPDTSLPVSRPVRAAQ